RSVRSAHVDIGGVVYAVPDEVGGRRLALPTGHGPVELGRERIEQSVVAGESERRPQGEQWHRAEPTPSWPARAARPGRCPQSARPGWARVRPGMLPKAPYRGSPPAGHCLRSSKGRLSLRSQATASLTFAWPGCPDKGGSGGTRAGTGSPSSARTRKSMWPDG